MNNFLFFIGALRLIFVSGNFIQSKFLRINYSSRITGFFQTFFVGLFAFVYLNFLVLEYFTLYFNLLWFEALRVIIIVYAIGTILYQMSRIKRSRDGYINFRVFLSGFTKLEKIFVFLVAIIWVMVSTLYVYENDALEYFAISREILSYNSLESYPPIRTDWKNSLYAPSTHPPFFHILMALFAPNADFLIGLRLILLIMCVGMVLILLNRNQFAYGFLVVASLPILIFGIQGLSIESFRLPFFASGLLIMIQGNYTDKFFIQFPRAFFGLAMMISTHSLGLLMGLLSIAAIYIVFRQVRTLLIHFTGLFFSILFFAPQYISNTIKFGSPVQDSSPILDLPGIAFYEDLKIRRQISTIPDMLVNGSLRPLIDFSLFGFVFAVGLLISLTFISKNYRMLSRTPLLSVSAVIVILFTTLQIGSSVLGLELLVKNVRYAVSIFPCVLILIVERMKPKFHE